MGSVWMNTSVPPGRMTVSKSFSLINLSFLNQALWALVGSFGGHTLPFPILQTLVVFFSHRIVGSRVGNVVALCAALLIRIQSCFEEAAGGSHFGSTLPGRKPDPSVSAPLSIRYLQLGQASRLYNSLEVLQEPFHIYMYLHICISKTE